MAAKNMMNAIDGRQAFVWYLEPSATPSAKTSLAVGDIVIVKSQNGDTSVFPANWANKPFVVGKAINNITTGSSGDVFYECKAHFIAMCQGKSINKSKNTTDVTTDADAMTNNICDGQVSTSGSLDLLYSVDGKGYASTFIKQRFGSVVLYKADGTYDDILESATDEKDLLLFAWNARDAKDDDIVEFEVIPALITSLDHSSSYGSSQSMSVSFTGNAADENGYEAIVIDIPGGKSVVKKLATTRAAADKAANPTG